MYFVFLDVERKRNLPVGMKTSGEDMSSACACIFEFSIVDIVDDNDSLSPPNRLPFV